MVVERAYNRVGLPAYVIVIKNAGKGSKSARELVYPKAANFERLWARGVEPAAPIVALDEETK